MLETAIFGLTVNRKFSLVLEGVFWVLNSQANMPPEVHSDHVHSQPSTSVALLYVCCSSHMNNIVRIMLRKGILTDLARVSHYLDLSSPNMPASVNAALKPLETLSRIVNQPTAATNNKAGKQKAQGSVSEEPAGDQTGPVYNIFA